MYEKILARVRQCVESSQVVIPTHALVAMAQDLLTTEDVCHCLLIGEIVERQYDRRYREWKYVVDGESLKGDGLQVVLKLHQIAGGAYVITVYRVY